MTSLVISISLSLAELTSSICGQIVSTLSIGPAGKLLMNAHIVTVLPIANVPPETFLCNDAVADPKNWVPWHAIAPFPFGPSSALFFTNYCVGLNRIVGCNPIPEIGQLHQPIILSALSIILQSHNLSQ